jgi:uncharacterized protein DUF4389
MDQETKNRLADRSIWVRALYMIIMVVAYSIGETLLIIISVFQFLCALITGRVNESLHAFGANLSAYMYDILQFATFNSEYLPFPFNDWPAVEPGDTPWSADMEPEQTVQPVVEPEEVEQPAAEVEPDYTAPDTQAGTETDDNPTKPSGA